MPDKYRNFAELSKNEVRDKDFVVRHRLLPDKPAVIAPHGGGIEPGTSELAEAIARDDLSFYAFEGKKARGNGELHITSARFDEAECLKLLASSSTCIALHGEDSDGEVVFLGGLNNVLGASVRACLEKRGFKVDIHTDPGLQGTDPKNICNRGTTGRGVQLELSEGLRRTFFKGLKPKSQRETKTDRFWQFVAALREAILEHDASKPPLPSA